MPKSPYATAIDGFQRALKPFLKGLGFRTRGRTFNRATADGLTQVINLQMGASDPPGTTYIPGLRENFHGWFTINLGVYIPEVARLHGGGEARGFVRDFHCCVRERIGNVGPEKRDSWWRISGDQELVTEIEGRIERDALPFLEAHASRDAILSACGAPVANLGFAGAPPRIVAAIVLTERGDRDAARALLSKQAQEQNNRGHPAYVRSLAEKLGVGPLDEESVT